MTSYFGHAWFNWVHGRNLIYNACWEDPRLDRVALDLGPDDSVLVITSAGCNALDYALAGAGHVHAVDLNPRQNALLELKLAGIRTLEYEEFFGLFGEGCLASFADRYASCLRTELSPGARQFWDRRTGFFTPGRWRNSFYFHGTAGIAAYMVNRYIDKVARVRDHVDALLAANSLAEQRDIYHNRLVGPFWTRLVRWLLARDASLSLLGVPKAQRDQVERTYGGGIAQFIQDCIEYVFTRLPFQDNYFWRVYLTGRYTRQCCPEYLTVAGFNQLKNGLADRVSVHTSSVAGFLDEHEQPISRFVLLDHMDWLSARTGELQREWQGILDRAAPGSRVIWRSGGLHVDFVDPLMVSVGRQECRLGELLTYERGLADELHQMDRVHTYGSFYIADLNHA